MSRRQPAAFPLCLYSQSVVHRERIVRVCPLGLTEELTPRAIAEALDQDAENINAHDFVGCHMKLAVLLHKIIGTKTKAVMLALAKERGLHGLEDVCSCRTR